MTACKKKEHDKHLGRLDQLKKNYSTEKRSSMTKNYKI